MVIFNSYVKLPEGKSESFAWKWLHRILESWMPHQLHMHTWEKCYGTGLCTIYYDISLGGWFSAGGPSINQSTRKGCHYNCEVCLGWLYHMGMDQYLLIPFLVGWTSMNPSYFDVNYRGTIGFDTLPYWNYDIWLKYMLYMIYGLNIWLNSTSCTMIWW